MKYIIIILFLLPITTHANNKHLHIGISSIYNNIDDKDYESINKYEDIGKPKFNYGIAFEFDKIIVDFTTNRLINQISRRTVRHKLSNKLFQNETELIYDSFSVGKRFNRFLPTIFIANTKIDKKLYDGNTLLGRKTIHTFLYGFNLNYLITRKISASLFYILQNNEADLKYSIGIGFNYIFEI